MYLERGTRRELTRLSPARRHALETALARVGCELLDKGEQVEVEPAWSRKTWPRRHYPKQCYARTLKYGLDHASIAGMRIVHGVASHGQLGVPFDHAWVELPRGIVFDAVVQTFFRRDSYYTVMGALPLDSYPLREVQRLLAIHQHPGPWTARWAPTRAHQAWYRDEVARLSHAGPDHASWAARPLPPSA